MALVLVTGARPRTKRDYSPYNPRLIDLCSRHVPPRAAVSAQRRMRENPYETGILLCF